MQQDTAELNPAETSGNSPPEPPREKAIADQTLALITHARPQRTAGLKIFDWVVYSLNNFLVFAVSVAATYLTTRGGDRDTHGTLEYGKIGNWFHKRGDWLLGKIGRFGIRGQAADFAKMVAFSFVDGSIFAVLVKLLENKREPIAKWIDERLGTVHPDERVYAAEPKQSWGSVAAGRALTAGIVLPVAFTLSKVKRNGESLNALIFNAPGQWVGKQLAKSPKIVTFFKPWKIEELARVSIFEAVYTTICTVGLYFTSRFVARKWEDHEKKKELIHELRAVTGDDPLSAAETTARLPAAATANKAEKPAAPLPAQPRVTIAHAATHGRVTAPEQQLAQ